MYNDEKVKITFVVPLSIKEKFQRYSKYTSFSMTDIFRIFVQELRVDPYTSTRDQIIHASTNTGKFVGIEPEEQHKKTLLEKLHLT